MCKVDLILRKYGIGNLQHHKIKYSEIRPAYSNTIAKSRASWSHTSVDTPGWPLFINLMRH